MEITNYDSMVLFIQCNTDFERTTVGGDVNGLLGRLERAAEFYGLNLSRAIYQWRYAWLLHNGPQWPISNWKEKSHRQCEQSQLSK